VEKIHCTDIQMELKYCERCGGLWLRLKGSDLVYCPSCAVALAGLLRTAKQTRQAADSQPGNFMPKLEGSFWSEGGTA
jgi:Zn-finger nucleic acid-binding protein